MIRVEKGEIQIEGTGAELMTDLSCLAFALSQNFDKDMLRIAFEIGIKEEFKEGDIFEFREDSPEHSPTFEELINSNDDDE